MTDATEYFEVVLNDEAQYSLWPAHKPLPPGWATVGKRGDEASCLAYIQRQWTDMRPRSLREPN